MPCCIRGYAILLLALFTNLAVALQQHPRSSSSSPDQSPTTIPGLSPQEEVQGLPVHRVLLRQNKDDGDKCSPYCLALSSIVDLPSSSNFLATQVWPSARVAAKAIEKYGPTLLQTSTNNKKSTYTICELGCGPGLPSITAASILQCNVIATDIDKFALQLVTTAAKQQNLNDFISSRICDLIDTDWNNEKWIESIDLFIMSDVFESEAIAKGAANLTRYILSNNDSSCGGSRLWVFAQSDRAQREIYLKELQRIYPNDEQIQKGWINFDEFPNEKDRQLWLCNLDETTVNYG